MKNKSTKKTSNITLPDYLKPIIVWSRLVGWTPEDFEGYVLRINNQPVLNADLKDKINHSVGKSIDRAIESRRQGRSPTTPALDRDFDIRAHIKAISDTVRRDAFSP